MEKHKTPYVTIAKLSKGERWLLGLLGVEITVSCTRSTIDSGRIFFNTKDTIFNEDLENIESFSVKFSHEGITQNNIDSDFITLGVHGDKMCYSGYYGDDKDESLKIKRDIVNEIKTYECSNVYSTSGIYFSMYSEARRDDTIPETFYRRITLLSFTTTDGVVHSIDNLNY